MSVRFEANRLKPGDPGFQYDVAKDFSPAVEASGWDSDSEQSEGAW